MGRVVSFEAPRRVGLADYRDPPLGTGEVRIQTLYSGISAGTELTAYRGSNPYLTKLWDDGRRLFVADDATFRYPVEGWGYEEVGRVAELGPDVDGIELDAIVYGAWGHRSTCVMSQEEGAARVLPDALEPICGIFSQIGAIALNAILDADIHVGERVAVFGQGVPGLIVTQLAALNGAEVIAVDAIGARLELATRLGAAHTIDATKTPPAETIKLLTDNLGADVSIEISGSYAALNEAIRSTAYNSRTVACGFFQGDGRSLFLGEEFHHNRVQVVCSQISGVSPRLDHRWDERRLQRTVMGLAARHRIDLGALVSKVFPIDEAADAFRLVDERPSEVVQVVLSFEEETR